MLSYIDPILFPDNCVLHEVSPDRYIYPIFKNGSDGVQRKAIRTLDHDQIFKLDNVEIFLRDPFDRYVSGVQSYLRFNPTLDRITALQLIDEFLFLNRHFTLQFHWIVNLQRFTNNASMTFLPMSKLTDIIGRPWNTSARDQALVDYFKDNEKLRFYLQLDKMLYEDFMGKTVKFKDILSHLVKFDSVLYKEVIQRSQDLCNVLG